MGGVARSEEVILEELKAIVAAIGEAFHIMPTDPYGFSVVGYSHLRVAKSTVHAWERRNWVQVTRQPATGPWPCFYLLDPEE